MKILPYSIETAKDLLTSRAGLTSIAQVMQAIELETTVIRLSPAQKVTGQYPNQYTFRGSHCIGSYEKPFGLIIQRSQILNQKTPDLGDESSSDNELEMDGYIYRAIATNHDDRADSEVPTCLCTGKTSISGSYGSGRMSV
ncbi:MAG: hypothetical protein CSB48_10075 [Proteobacteria bacterium]|nr:MAG: hypothetical protein CSB48_10075 [Pseudomonadota bacterium]